MTNGRGPNWTPAEDARLRELHAAGEPIAAIAAALGRPKQGVQNRLHRLGAVRRSCRPWTAKEVAYVRANLALLGIDAVAAHLGRTRSQVHCCAQNYGAEAGHAKYVAARRKSRVLDLAGKGLTAGEIAAAPGLGLGLDRVQQILTAARRQGLLVLGPKRKRGSGGVYTYKPTRKWVGNYSEDFRG